jgi:hypothetical protein
VIDVVKKIAQGHDDWKLGGCDSNLINIEYQRIFYLLKAN